jgi:hypothetical protein
MTRRTGILVGVLIVLLLAVTWWSHSRMADSRAAAITAGAAARACRQMTQQIKLCRRRPAIASGQERLASEVTGLIEAAAKAAGIRADKLVRISPEPAQRLEDAAYKDKPTRVRLTDVRLKEFVALLHKLLLDKTGLHDKSIRISASQRDDTGDLWGVELVLTYLIYDPPRPAK